MTIDIDFYLEQAPSMVACLGCGSIFLDSVGSKDCPVCGGWKFEKGWTPWFPVNSSNLAAVRFCPYPLERGHLEVKFRSGDVYRYTNVKNGSVGVPVEVFKDLADPALPMSHGRYFNDRVKGVYEFHKKVG